MTYQELTYRNQLINTIPMSGCNKDIDANLAASIILLQVEYQHKVSEFETFMQDVLKGLKKEGFDDRLRKHQEMLNVDERQKAYDTWKEDSDEERPTAPTDEERLSADEWRPNDPDFIEEFNELDKSYLTAYNKKLKEEVSCDIKLSREDFAKLVAHIGLEGTIAITALNGQKVEMSNTEFLKHIGYYFL